jgi:hypothetical protein
MRRACFLLIVTLLVAGLAIPPAHAGGSGHSHHESSAGLVAALLLGAVIVLGLAAAGRWRRPAVVVALGLLVALFSVESAVHSAHHFADPQARASCALFAASQHDEGAGAVATVTATPTWTTEPSPPHEVVGARPLHAFRSHEVRAPPSVPSR